MTRVILLAVMATATYVGAGVDAADPRATVAQGVLSGTMDSGVTVFRGVPFAAPPVGDLRWAPPRPPASWTRPREAKAFGAACTQTLKAARIGTVDHRVYESRGTRRVGGLPVPEHLDARNAHGLRAPAREPPGPVLDLRRRLQRRIRSGRGLQRRQPRQEGSSSSSTSTTGSAAWASWRIPS